MNLLMEQLLLDFISQMGLALPIVILVSIRAGRMLNEIRISEMETTITNLSLEIVKEEIVNRLDILWRVFRDFNGRHDLPEKVNLQEACDRLFFSSGMQDLNNIYLDLISQGAESEFFVQVFKFIVG